MSNLHVSWEQVQEFLDLKKKGIMVKDAPLYIVSIKANKEEKVIKTHTFAEALLIQKGASAMAELLGWTRHSSCTGIVRHLHTIFDLYNEGHIVVDLLDE